MKSQKGRNHFRVTFILLLAWMIPASATALDVQGSIDSDSNWTTTDSPVHITSDLIVAQGATLTIDPGVEVIFDSRPDTSRGYNLTVEGTLVASGSDTRPIVFTAQDTDKPWGAIIFNDTCRDWNAGEYSGSILSYCVIEYGGNYPTRNAMIVTRNALPRIANNTIRFSSTVGVGAYASADAASPGGEISIIGNRIHNNSMGIRLYGEGGSVENNYFLNNIRALDVTSLFYGLDIRNNTIKSSSSQLLGSGLRLSLMEGFGGIRSYKWEQTGGTEVVIDNPESATTTFTAPEPENGMETLSFNLTVTGESGDKDTESVEITIIGDNEPPVASAGSDRNVAISDIASSSVTVTLSGAGSHDSDLGIAHYQWSQISGRSVSIKNSSNMTATFDVPSLTSPGEEMTFMLTVTDNGGLPSTDEVTIRYYDSNIYPSANAGTDITVFQGALVTLDGSASRDSDGGIRSYLWSQTGGPSVLLFNADTGQPFFAAPNVDQNEEVLTFSLQVTDTGGQSDTDEVAVTVKGTVMADPGDDQEVDAGQEVTLTATGSFDLSAIADVTIEANDVESDNSEAGLLAFTASENANYQLYVTGNNLSFTEEIGYGVFLSEWVDATTELDMMGNWWGTDDTATINEMIHDQNDDAELPAVNYEQFNAEAIEEAGSTLNYPAIADAGPDATTAVDVSVTLDGSGSYDPDGIGEYLWQQIDGLTVALKNAESQTATFIAPAGGTEGEELHFSLTMTTDGIFSHTDEVTITVIPDEDYPTVEVGGDGECFIESACSQNGQAGKKKAVAILMLIGIFVAAFVSRRLKAVMTAGLISIFLLIASTAHAGFFALGGGDGGDAEQFNVTLEAGAKDITTGPVDLLFAIGLPFTPHGDEKVPEDTIASPCPNDECILLGEFPKGTEVGLHLKLGIELGSSNLYLNAIGGGAVVTESELSLSQASGYTYEEAVETRIEPYYGGGLSFFPDFDMRFLIQVDYDTRRGITGTIGWYW